MGNQPNSPLNNQLTLSTNSSKNMKYIQEEIDKFYLSQLPKKQFVEQLFLSYEKIPHPLVGNLRICRTYILERLFLILTQNGKNAAVLPKDLKQFIQSIFKNPEKAIQKSFQLFDLDGDKFIAEGQFLNYIDFCFMSLMAAFQKDCIDKNFKLSLKQWLSKNKMSFYNQIMKIFQNNKRSHPEKWNYADFKRWILSGENWTLDITLGGQKLRTPLNLLCLFRIKNPMP